MIFWVFGSLALVAGFLASLMADMRKAVLSLWVCGLSVGGLFLGMGAELLAVVQWILSTLTAIAFIFYAMMFGEYGRSAVAEVAPGSVARKMASVLMPAMVGGAFAGSIFLGAEHLPAIRPEKIGPQPMEHSERTLEPQSVEEIGSSLANSHFISLEIVGLMLLLAVVGSGVVARPEKEENGEEETAS